MSVSVMDIALQSIDCLVIFCEKLNFPLSDSTPASVIPAKAGIHFDFLALKLNRNLAI